MLIHRPLNALIPVLCQILLSGKVSCESADENWTHFRGSRLDGIADVKSAPVSWAADSNIVWETAIHGKGWSSPVVFGNQIWLSTATEDGKEMSALCVDFQSGEIIHTIPVFTPDTIYRKHAVNSYATPTRPCSTPGLWKGQSPDTHVQRMTENLLKRFLK
jgi:hypothetical protein